MVLIGVLTFALLGLPQEPFQPMDFSRTAPVTGTSPAREDWVRVTNQRLEMSRSTLRVAQEGLTAIVLAPGVDKPRHARPILLGKGEHQLLFRSIVGLGFNRILVRNPDTGKEWGARLEKGKPVLD